MRIALYQPDIPQNTGTILRLSACLGLPVDVIGPAGFDISDKNLRRAALDYMPFIDLTRHESWGTFQTSRQVVSKPGRLVLLSSKATVNYLDFAFDVGDTLLLGRESAGVPQAVHDAVDASVTIAMRPGTRSLNIAVATAMVVGEAIRQVRRSVR